MGFQAIITILGTWRLDVLLTLIIALLLYIFLVYRRFRFNKELKTQGKTQKDILIITDFIYSIVTSATIYGGISAIYFSFSGKLLFNQNFIISQEYITAFAGVVLFALGLIAMKQAIKGIREENQK